MVSKATQLFNRLPFKQLSFSQRLFLIAVGLLVTLVAFNGSVPLQAASTPGSVDPTFQSGRAANGAVGVMAIQSDDKIIIGGQFANYDSGSRNSLARLNADGSLDTTFNPGTGANGAINALAVQSDGKILIGGQFTSYNGTTRNYVARVNADGSLDTTFNPTPGAGGSVTAVVVQSDGKILIGGNFTTYNGASRNFLARVNGDGSLDTTFSIGMGPNTAINSIAIQADGKILIGGQLTAYNGTTRKGIARLNADGSLDTAFDSTNGANGTITSIALQPDGKVVIVGGFSNYGGVSRNQVGRLNSDGTLDTTFNPGTGFNNFVFSVVLQADGKLVIGGNFTTYNGTARNNITRVNTDGTLDTSFNPGTGASNVVASVRLQSSNKIIIGGQFTAYNGVGSNRLARLNTDGSADATFNFGTGTNANITAIKVQSDDKILIGGNFNTYNGVGRSRIARLNPDGTLDTTFNPGIGTNSSLTSIVVQNDGKILIGGNFTSYNGTARGFIARVNSDGSLDTTFNPGTGADSTVSAIGLQSDGKIIIAGGFLNYNGIGRSRIARLNADGSLDTTFNPITGANNPINALALQSDGKIIIAGQFTTYNGTSTSRIARVNTDGSLDTTFNLGAGVNGTVYTLALQNNGKIVIGGQFTAYDGVGRSRVARVNTDGTLDTGFNFSSGANSTVFTLIVQADNKVIIGGSFTSFDGTARNRITRLTSNGSLDTTFNPGTGANGDVGALAYQNDNKVLMGGFFTAVDTYTRDYLARLENNVLQPTTTTLVSSLNPSGFGQSVTFTATVSPISATGTVVFSRSSAPLGTVTVTNGIATFTTSSLPVGSNLISAQYNGDSNFSFSVSNFLIQVVQASNINFSSAAYTVTETGGTAVFTVTRSGSFFGPATAQIQVLNQSADARDYQIPLPGSLDTTFGDAGVVGQRVRRMIAQPDGKIIIGGTFSQVGGQNRSSLARLNSDGTLDSSFSANAGVNGTIYEMALQPDGKIVVAGAFSLANGVARNNIARLNADGSLDSTFNPDLNNYVLGLRLQLDGKLLVGGEFTQAGGQAHTRIVRLNADGSVDNTFSSTASANALVRTFVPQADGKIYVGGEFTQLNGTTRAKFVRLNSDGTLDNTFTDLALNGEVYRAILLPSGKVLVGGTFTQAGGQTHNRLVQLNADGSVDATFVAGTNDYVAELEYTPSGKLVILGIFSQVNGIAQGGVAQLYADGTLDNSYTDLGLGGQVFALGVQGNDAILIGGEFTQVAGFTRRLVARVYGNFGEVRWQDGEGGNRIIQMPIVNDSLAEGNETFVLTVTNPVNLVPIAPSSAIVTILDNSTVLTVTQPTDDGSGQVPNSLSWALVQPLLAGQGTVIRFNVPGNLITVGGTLPVVKAGVFVDGGATGIIIDGNGLAGDGVRLSGNNSLSSLLIRRFAGRELVLLGNGNRLYKVRIES